MRVGRAGRRRSRSSRTASTSTSSGRRAAAPEPRTVVFNGMLDYRPNLDAALHLVDEIWPRVRASLPRRAPDHRRPWRTPADIARLRRPGVAVTGRGARRAAVPRAGGGRRRADPDGRRDAAQGRRGARDGQADGVDDARLRGRRRRATASTCCRRRRRRVRGRDRPPVRAPGPRPRAGRRPAAASWSASTRGTRRGRGWTTSSSASALARGAAGPGPRAPRRGRGGRAVSGSAPLVAPTRRPSSPPRACIVREMDEYEPPVQREAEALVAAGFDVEVLCMRHAKRPRRIVVNGVQITSLPQSTAARRRFGTSPTTSGSSLSPGNVDAEASPSSVRRRADEHDARLPRVRRGGPEALGHSGDPLHERADARARGHDLPVAGGFARSSSESSSARFASRTARSR